MGSITPFITQGVREIEEKADETRVFGYGSLVFRVCSSPVSLSDPFLN